MNSLDHLQVSLEGRKLIESSAGTGKTYAIASLYARLLLQKRLETHEILVVTFTEAATNDLRRRIRESLRSTLTTFDLGRSDDPFLVRLLQETSDIPRARRLLNTALQSFDEAAIFTIHGFCQRILQEGAFETAFLFDTELVTDQRHIVQEVVDDFWRHQLYGASTGFLQHALSRHLSPKRLVECLGNSPTNPFLTLLPELSNAAIGAIGPLEDKVHCLFEEARQVWIDSRRAIEDLLADHRGLNKGTHSKNAILQNVLEAERYLSTENPFPLSSAIEKFSNSALSKATKKGYAPPEHRFFSICEDLKSIHSELTRFYDLKVIALKSALLRYVRRELRARKQQQNVRFFDDLLLDLYSVLQSRRGAEVAEAIRNRYRAVLIDEFQDTDPVQYAIFRSVYNHPGVSLFLIGDPKQAIYSFRGADIFAYLRAAKEISDKYTLTQNWRSTPELITAINAIFARAEFPFVFPEIEFHAAQAAPQAQPQGFTWAARTDPSPFKIWFVDRSDGQELKPINKGRGQPMGGTSRC
jgi:exodeoxyribonuclease V beta subunit